MSITFCHIFLKLFTYFSIPSEGGLRSWAKPNRALLAGRAKKGVSFERKAHKIWAPAIFCHTFPQPRWRTGFFLLLSSLLSLPQKSIYTLCIPYPQIPISKHCKIRNVLSSRVMSEVEDPHLPSCGPGHSPNAVKIVYTVTVGLGV